MFAQLYMNLVKKKIFVIWGLEVYKTYDVWSLGFKVSILGYKHKTKLISRKVRLSYD